MMRTVMNCMFHWPVLLFSAQWMFFPSSAEHFLWSAAPAGPAGGAPQMSLKPQLHIKHIIFWSSLPGTPVSSPPSSVNGSANNAISILSILIAELSLCTMWHVTRHAVRGKRSVWCTWLRLGHLSVRVGDSSRRSERIAKNLELRLWMRLLLSLKQCQNTYMKLKGRWLRWQCQQKWSQYFVVVFYLALWCLFCFESHW